MGMVKVGDSRAHTLIAPSVGRAMGRPARVLGTTPSPGRLGMRQALNDSGNKKPQKEETSLKFRCDT